MLSKGGLLVCALLFAGAVCDAQPRGKVYKSRTGWAYDYAYGQRGSNPYKGIYAEFNPQGYKTLRIQYDRFGRVVEKMKYHYVEGFRLIKLERFAGAGGDSLIWFKEFEYDKDGNNTSQIWKDGLGNITQKDLYFFNKNGFQSEEERYRPYGTFFEYVENKFDPLGRLLESEIYDQEGRRKAVSRYIYNEYGEKLEKSSRLSADKEQKSTYQYSTENELVSSYFFFNSDPIMYFEYSHEYW